MAKQKWRVTAYEIVAVTREYAADSEHEAVEKMSKWTRVRREEEGRDFTGTLRVPPTPSNI